MREAAARGGKLAARGTGRWWPDSAQPAGPAGLSTSCLDTISAFNPADLVVTVGAGTPLDRLQARLA